MRSIFYLIIAFVTFLIGVSAVSVWNINRRSIDIQPQNPSLRSFESLNYIQSLISSLSSENEQLRIEAEKELIRFGQESSEQRSKVIQSLLHSAEAQADLNNGRCFILGSRFSYWSSVTNVFAELRATEAIDLMIRTIHCGNGWTGSLNEEPSFDALFKMGKVAIPQLSEALKHESNQYRKIELSHCLSLIRNH